MVFVIFFFSIANATEIKSDAQAIGKAGMQRVLVLEMLKDFAMIGLGVTYSDPKSELEKTIQMFETYQKLLYDYTDGSEIRKSIAKTNALWEDVKKIIIQKPQKIHIEQLQKKKYITALRESANETVLLFVDKLGVKKGKKINLAGRLRAVSQKIAGAYMLKAWGFKSPSLDKKIASAMKTFTQSYNELSNSQDNTPAEKEILTRIKKLLIFFKIKTKSNAYFTPLLVSKYSDEQLDLATQLTKLYAKDNN